jgi:hypothetical protein
MGTNKQRPCKGGCGKLAYGTHCRPCSFALKPISARVGKPQRCRTDHPSVNTVGEFNASGGFSGQSGIAFPKRIEPTESGWIGKDRDELAAWVAANQRRMTQGSGANWRPDAASQVWSF